MSGTRAILERLWGFAEPIAGGAGAACAYCTAPAALQRPAADHEADCPYWDAAAAFDSPAARRLVAHLVRVGGSAAAAGRHVTDDRDQSSRPR